MWETDPLGGRPSQAPAIVRQRYGKGQAILAGGYLGLSLPAAVTAQLAPSGFTQADIGSLAESALSENRRLIRALFFRVMPELVRPAMEGEEVRVDVLRTTVRQAVIVQNLRRGPAVGRVHIPGVVGRLDEIFGLGALELDAAGGGALDLPPGAVRVYMTHP